MRSLWGSIPYVVTKFKFVAVFDYARSNLHLWGLFRFNKTLTFKIWWFRLIYISL